MNNRKLGTVKWFNEVQGYGYIRCSDGQDVYVNYKEIRAEGYKLLEHGQRVNFIISRTKKGLKALDVKIEDMNNDR